MKNIFDIMKDENFRKCVSKKIAKCTNNSLYMFPDRFPLLHSYTKLTDYSVNAIINKSISLSNISEFNDIYDGSLQRQSYDEIKKEVETMYSSLVKIENQTGNTVSIEDYKSTIEEVTYNLNNRNVEDFRSIDSLGIYIRCFSTDNDSILMWSHYADDNKGICVTYDFNELEIDNIFRYNIFPVAYSDTPFFVPDSFFENDTIYNYEANILFSILNKCSVWKYEKEWRLIFWNIYAKTSRYSSLTLNIIPKQVIFGCRFLKSLCYWGKNDYNSAKQNITNIVNLLSFLSENNSCDEDFNNALAVNYPKMDHNKRFNHSRSKIKSVSLETLTEESDDEFEIADSADVADEALAQLRYAELMAVANEQEKQVIEMMSSGYSQQEIADKLGISQGAVSKKIKKFKNFLKSEE